MAQMPFDHFYNIQMLWLIFPVLLLVHHSDQYEGRVVCYFRSDNVYRAEGFRMQPREVDANLCTHLIYFTAYLHPQKAIASSDPHVDLAKGGYKKIVKLKEKNPNLKVMLSLGVDPNGRDLWPLIAARETIRRWFSALVVQFLADHKFDGLDIDWLVHDSKTESDNYVYLLRDLRDHMDLISLEYGLPRMELSVLLPAQIQQLHRHFHLSSLSTYVDFINVATMDYWALDPYTVQHHAPLYRNDTEGSHSSLNVDDSIQYYLYKTVPPEKLVLGIPMYGRSFQLDNSRSYGIGSYCKYPGASGFATNSLGTLAFFEICTYINEDDWTVQNEHLTSMGPYAHSNDRWVGYDDVAMISKKAKYVRERNLGGLMFWTIDQDDFRGYCNHKNSLLRTGKFTLDTGIPVYDASMLQKLEQVFDMEKDEGYNYPKPTSHQPCAPCPSYKPSSTLPTSVNYNKDQHTHNQGHIPTKMPSHPSINQRPTTSKMPHTVNGNNNQITSSHGIVGNKPAIPNYHPSYYHKKTTTTKTPALENSNKNEHSGAHSTFGNSTTEIPYYPMHHTTSKIPPTVNVNKGQHSYSHGTSVDKSTETSSHLKPTTPKLPGGSGSNKEHHGSSQGTFTGKPGYPSDHRKPTTSKLPSGSGSNKDHHTSSHGTFTETPSYPSYHKKPTTSYLPGGVGSNNGQHTFSHGTSGDKGTQTTSFPSDHRKPITSPMPSGVGSNKGPHSSSHGTFGDKSTVTPSYPSDHHKPTTSKLAGGVDSNMNHHTSSHGNSGDKGTQTTSFPSNHRKPITSQMPGGIGSNKDKHTSSNGVSNRKTTSTEVPSHPLKNENPTDSMGPQVFTVSKERPNAVEHPLDGQKPATTKSPMVGTPSYPIDSSNSNDIAQGYPTNNQKPTPSKKPPNISSGNEFATSQGSQGGIFTSTEMPSYPDQNQTPTSPKTPLEEKDGITMSSAYLTTTIKPVTGVTNVINQTINNSSTSSSFPTTSSVPRIPPPQENVLSPSSTESNFTPTTSPPIVTSNPSGTNNAIDENGVPGANVAISQLNNVLNTVNKLLTDINSISSQQGSGQARNNLTIDPSFLNSIQPLLNLRNTGEITMSSSQNENGGTMNSTVSIQSDVKKFNIRNNGTTATPDNPTSSTNLMLSNLNNSSEIFSLFSSLGPDKRVVLSSGRDIVNINLNITINNNFYDMN